MAATGSQRRRSERKEGEKGRSTLGCSEVPIGRWRYWRSQNKASHGSPFLYKAPRSSTVKTLKILQPSLWMGRVSEAPRGGLSSSVRGAMTTMSALDVITFQGCAITTHPSLGPDPGSTQGAVGIQGNPAEALTREKGGDNRSSRPVQSPS